MSGCNSAAGGAAGPCGSAADFHFTVSDATRAVQLALREGVVSADFFAAVQRVRATPDSDDARMALADEKTRTAQLVESTALAALFDVCIIDRIESAGACRA